ncbi:hypothetical protein GF352_00360 [archaeon]|nr:hypothetical protein [archaeon]
MDYTIEADNLEPYERADVNRIVQLAVDELGSGLEQVILFGSALKEKEHGDVDLALIVNKAQDPYSNLCVLKSGGYIPTIFLEKVDNKMFNEDELRTDKDLKSALKLYGYEGVRDKQGLYPNARVNDLIEGELRTGDSIIHYLVMHNDWFELFEKDKELLNESTYKLLKSLKDDGLFLYSKN